MTGDPKRTTVNLYLPLLLEEVYLSLIFWGSWFWNRPSGDSYSGQETLSVYDIDF